MQAELNEQEFVRLKIGQRERRRFAFAEPSKEYFAARRRFESGIAPACAVKVGFEISVVNGIERKAGIRGTPFGFPSTPRHCAR